MTSASNPGWERWSPSVTGPYYVQPDALPGSPSPPPSAIDTATTATTIRSARGTMSFALLLMPSEATPLWPQSRHQPGTISTSSAGDPVCGAPNARNSGPSGPASSARIVSLGILNDVQRAYIDHLII